MLSVVFCTVWDVACCVWCNNGGDDRMITVTVQFVLSLGIILLIGVGVKCLFGISNVRYWWSSLHAVFE